MKGSPIRVLLADDHAIFRDGIKLLLSSRPQYQIAAEADSYESTLQQLADNTIDCLILDYRMPDASGIDGIERVRAIYPDLPIVLLSGVDSGQVLNSVISAGVSAVVIKEGDGEELFKALDQLGEAECYISPAAMQHLLEDGEVLLSPREQQVLTLLAEGMSNQGIGEALSISPKTVDKHRGSLMHKLEVHSAAELVARALRRGYIQ